MSKPIQCTAVFRKVTEIRHLEKCGCVMLRDPAQSN
jgi:hypothetical protein